MVNFFPSVLLFTPSICWFSMMLAPYLYMLKDMEKEIYMIQLPLILLVSVCILIADVVSYRWNCPSKKIVSKSSSSRTDWIGYVILLLFGTHLYLMPHIPLLHWALGGVTEDQLVIMREEASKLLDVSPLYIYLLQFSQMIALPILISISYIEKRYKHFAILSIGTILYSAIALAKLPFAVFLLMTVAGIISLGGFQLKSKRAMGIFLIPILLVAAYAVNFFVNHPYSIFNFRVPDPDVIKNVSSLTNPPTNFLVPDHNRLLYLYNPQVTRPLNVFELRLNSLMYRIFLVPPEVSYRWYDYYSKTNKKIGLYGITPESRSDSHFIHPANEVGLWAFKRRFPREYFETVRAYASADADMFARFGLWGVVLLCISYIVVRFAAAYRNIEDTQRIGHVLFVVVIGFSIPIGSLQAFFVANGGGLLFLVLIASKLGVMNRVVR